MNSQTIAEYRLAAKMIVSFQSRYNQSMADAVVAELEEMYGDSFNQTLLADAIDEAEEERNNA